MTSISDIFHSILKKKEAELEIEVQRIAQMLWGCGHDSPPSDYWRHRDYLSEQIKLLRQLIEETHNDIPPTP